MVRLSEEKAGGERGKPSPRRHRRDVGSSGALSLAGGHFPLTAGKAQGLWGAPGLTVCWFQWKEGPRATASHGGRAPRLR